MTSRPIETRLVTALHDLYRVGYCMQINGNRYEIKLVPDGERNVKAIEFSWEMTDGDVRKLLLCEPGALKTGGKPAAERGAALDKMFLDFGIMFRWVTEHIQERASEERAKILQEWSDGLDDLVEERHWAANFIGPLEEHPGKAQKESDDLFRSDRKRERYPLYTDSPIVAYSKGDVIPYGEPATFRSISHGWLYPVVTGQIDNQARNAFSNGQCQAMAYALHEVTGWPIQAVMVRDRGCISMRHWLVRTPDGYLLDVNGLLTDQEVMDLYAVDGGEVTIRTLSQTEIDNVMNSVTFQVPHLPLARSFVPAVLGRTPYFDEFMRASNANAASFNSGATTVVTRVSAVTSEKSTAGMGI